MDLPAASRLVSSLEKELGVEILDRKRKPAQIVLKSLELFSEADRIARQYQRLLKTAESIKHQTRLSRSGFESELAGEYRSAVLT